MPLYLNFFSQNNSFCLFVHGIKYSYFSESVVTEKTVGFVENCRFSLIQFHNVLEFRY